MSVSRTTLSKLAQKVFSEKVSAAKAEGGVALAGAAMSRIA